MVSNRSAGAARMHPLANYGRRYITRSGAMWGPDMVALCFALAIRHHDDHAAAIRATARRLVPLVCMEHQPNMKKLARGTDIDDANTVSCALAIINRVCEVKGIRPDVPFLQVPPTLSIVAGQGGKASMTTTKQQRVEHCNQLIGIIASHGRQFFRCKSTGNVASMEVDARGRVWFHDYYTRKRIYTHETSFGNEWRGFTSGGTLRSLVEELRDYIRTGKPLARNRIGFTRNDGSNIWGYSQEAIEACRAECYALPMFRALEAVA